MEIENSDSSNLSVIELDEYFSKQGFQQTEDTLSSWLHEIKTKLNTLSHFELRRDDWNSVNIPVFAKFLIRDYLEEGKKIS